MVPWFSTFLLLFHAIRGLCNFPSPKKRLNEDNELQSRQTKLGQANFISRLTFAWISPLMSLGHSKPLSVEDIPTLLQEDEAQVAYERFSSKWDFLCRDLNSGNTRNLLFKTLVLAHWKEAIPVGVFAFLRTVAVAASPLLLYGLVQYTKNEHRKLAKGLILAGCLAGIKFIESISQRHWYFNSRRHGMRMRSALMVAIFQKQLKLSCLGRRRHSTGEIVNHIAVDAYRMGDTLWWFHMAWSLILQLLLAIGILYKIVGLGALPGLVPIAVIACLNVPFANMCNKYQSRFMVAQDKRLSATTEVLNNMKIIKLQSWEEKFQASIDFSSATEYEQLAKFQFKRAYATILYWMSPTIASAVIFFGCILTKSAPLNAATIFSVLATLRSMSEPMRWIPEALSALIQVKVSLDRLNDFLLEEELEKGDNMISGKKIEPHHCIEIQGGNYSWEPESGVLALRDINLEVKMGQKIAVCGPVGSGKSSLLSAILGEIPRLSGIVRATGSMAYVPQAPWIQSGTVGENILCGKTMNKIAYDKVVKACALDKDISSFSHGDQTEIGQRGLNLSGGQKQRVQLARAVYKDSDIYLLDDPFSAVDAHTAAHLFNECVLDALKDKTVILVTHQVEFLSGADKILVMQDGQVTQSGSYEELLDTGTAFEQLVNAHKIAATELTSSGLRDKIEMPQTDIEWFLESSESCSTKETNEGEILVEGQLTKEEEREIGNIGLRTLLDYINISKGFLFFSLTVLSYSAFAVFQAAASYWLATAIRIPRISSVILVGVYTGISLFSTPFVYLKSLFGALLGLKASKAFFSGLSNSLFKAPMFFFDSTPVGRIYTRLSSDMSTLDLDLPVAIANSAAASIDLLTIIAVMAFVTWPVIIVAIPAIILAIYAQRYYLSTASELMRINGTTKAPIMSFAAETSQGVVIIRAFNIKDLFFENYVKLIDADAKLFFHSNAATEWLVLRVEALQNLILLTAAFLIVLFPWKHLPGYVGLSLSYALTLSAIQVIMTRFHCNLSNNLVSVERIKQFMHIPPEPAATIEGMKPPLSWPPHGRIELQDIKGKYRANSPLVLKGITCTFAEGSRVGVVGRTGSGKTTLISALFRLVEPESGRILIDGLDICTMGLKDLRTKLSIIPQEPTLFKGSVRTNLDPLDMYTDKEIWDGIEKCQLKTTISNLPKLLDSSVSDEGENWSVGQRQLFCLGRVLLRRNIILILDEATASVDTATDAILQRVIRDEFPGCTVITIAHRVPTVIDSDMVMVLSNGEMVEYDVPSKLMVTNSSFSKLVGEYWFACNRNSI